MNIAIGSAFRNSAGPQINLFMRQVDALVRFRKQDHVRIIAVEGDSTDNTRAQLMKEAGAFVLNLQLLTCNHGGPVFGSTEHTDRLNALTKVGNAILGGVTQADDVVVYVESDLIWHERTISSLIDIVADAQQAFDVVSPLVFAGANFYDIFCYRKNGVRFSPFAPYHPDLAPRGVTEVDSVGSCLVMRGKVAREVRMPEGGVLIGFCEEVRKAGFRIGVNVEHCIKHPA